MFTVLTIPSADVNCVVSIDRSLTGVAHRAAQTGVGESGRGGRPPPHIGPERNGRRELEISGSKGTGIGHRQYVLRLDGVPQARELGEHMIKPVAELKEKLAVAPTSPMGVPQRTTR